MINKILLVIASLVLGFVIGQNYSKITIAVNLDQIIARDNSQLALSYSNMVSHYYSHTLVKTIEMDAAIKSFLENPNVKSLGIAKEKWIEARKIYGITEAFRFYGGPIDGTNQYGEEGPEGLINSWPLNEAYIDYVEGNPEAGLINNKNFEITSETILASNQSGDDADVSSGWHAIEFLLWGQDHSLETAGKRPVSDYTAGNNNNDRRRAYLSETTSMLLKHIDWLNKQWLPEGNGRKTFMGQKDNGGSILTGITTLAGFELSSERIATALDSGDPEDEHSCFSDQTHIDIKANFNGIKNVYLGIGLNGEKFSPSISDLVGKNTPSLNKKIQLTLEKIENNIKNITVPFDKMLSEPENGLGRAAAEKTVENLIILAESLKEAGKELNWNVIIAE